MTIITKVGRFCVDHMNDDMPEVNSVLVPRLSPPSVFKERAWEQGYLNPEVTVVFSLATESIVLLCYTSFHIKINLLYRPYPGGVASRLPTIVYVAMIMPILYDNSYSPNY